MAISASPVLAAARKSLGGNRYRALIQEAHARGYKAESYVTGKAAGKPEGLAERTTASLRGEAQKAVNIAYAPAEGVLNSALAREQALNDKRDRDLAAYQQWASGQQQRFQQAAFAAQAQILNQNSEILAQTGAARAQSQAAIQNQLAPLGGDLASSAQNALAMRPESAAAQAASTEMVNTEAARTTAAAQRNTSDLTFMGTNQLGALASIREIARLKGSDREQAIKDQLGELGGKKAGDFATALSNLGKGEQDKILEQYKGQVASDIAAGKESFTANENALNRALKTTLAKQTNDTKLALAKSKRDADAAKFDAKQYTDAVAFKAKYAGLTQEEVAGMSATELQTKLAAARKAAGTGAQKPPTLTQKANNEKDLGRALGKVREAHGHRSEADIRKMLREGVPAVIKHGRVEDPGIAAMQPDLVNAAIDIIFNHGLSDLNRQRIADLGIDVTRYGRYRGKKHASGSK